MVPGDLEQRIATLSNPQGLPFTPLTGAPTSGAKMKGFPLIHLLDLMDHEGPEVAAEWRATLPEDVRAATERRAITSVAWVPFEYYFHGVGWLAQRRGRGIRGAMEIGHHTANLDIGAFFRFVLAFASPSTVVSLSGRFWKSYFDRSTLHIVSSTPHSCEVEIRDWPLRDEASVHEMAGSLVAWMEAGRAKNMRITQFERASASLFRLSAEWS
ncbi:MAG: hypothetical protein JNM17_00405 [Archangium sp.]|nr:hypothetical protein [Archangium sp.]